MLGLLPASSPLVVPHPLSPFPLSFSPSRALHTQVADTISELKLGNGTSILIFANIASSLPSSVGAALTQAADKDSSVLGVYALAWLLTTLGIVYVQDAERQIPITYASRYRAGALQQQAYLPFKVGPAAGGSPSPAFVLSHGMVHQGCQGLCGAVVECDRSPAAAGRVLFALFCPLLPPPAPTPQPLALPVPDPPGERHRRDARHLLLLPAGAARLAGALCQLAGA